MEVQQVLSYGRRRCVCGVHECWGKSVTAEESYEVDCVEWDDSMFVCSYVRMFACLFDRLEVRGDVGDADADSDANNDADAVCMLPAFMHTHVDADADAELMLLTLTLKLMLM